MSTNISRNTIDGLFFEKQTNRCPTNHYVDISKRNLKKFLNDAGIQNPLDYLSWMFQPDEGYFLPDTKEVIIYEKNFSK